LAICRGFKDEAMKKLRFGVLAVAWLWIGVGCAAWHEKPYGEEQQLFLPGEHRQIWAIAPAINISGESQIDPLLQSDLVYQEMQKIHGLTVIPVDRVVEVYVSLKIDKIQNEQQAYAICKALGCDGLVVPTVTAYDPYDPPKFGASLQLFTKPGTFGRMPKLDLHALEQSATTTALPPMPETHNMAQVVEIYDASDGTVRARVSAYSEGRTDPNGPLGVNEITESMDRYCAFGYHELLNELLGNLNEANAG
jgi:hypothetical protein